MKSQKLHLQVNPLCLVDVACHICQAGSENDNERTVLQEGNVGKNVPFRGDPCEVKPYFKMVHLIDTDCQKIVSKSPQLFNVMELYKIRT